MNIELLDSRRLTGPNLHWDWPGAILDIALADDSAGELISAWSDEVKPLMEAMGWCAEHICSRIYQGGVSLVINAPIDVLYTACELNEVALNRATARLSGQQSPDPSEAIADLLTQRS